MKNIEILCTLGPASMNRAVIHRLTEIGVSLLRVNLSHTSIEDLPLVLETISSHTDVPICLDTEGAQIRTGQIDGGQIDLVENTIVDGFDQPRIGSGEGFYFHPGYVVDQFEVGDFLSIDFNSVLCQVVGKDENRVRLRVVSGGRVGQNKAVSINRSVRLAPLTVKDEEAIAIGREAGVRDFALSFAGSRKDVELIRSLAGEDSRIISKIESRRGLRNLEEIALASDALLLDRGDMSREVPVEKIPLVQRRFLRVANDLDVRAYVATNLLESMIEAPGPTRAEVNDVYTTIELGVDGLVLAAETAVGHHPVKSAQMIRRLIDEYTNRHVVDEGHYVRPSLSMLIEPHGGRLVHREVAETDLSEFEGLRRIKPSTDVLADCEQLALGTYSPLEGFMDEETLESVTTRCRLPDDTVWPLPVVLSLPPEHARDLNAGRRVVLAGPDGAIRYVLDVTSVYEADLERIAELVFGTTSREHPGVKKFIRQSSWFVGGKVSLVKRMPSLHRQFELSPHESRLVFMAKGWSRVVGFHSRNAPHRVHEHIQLRALAETHSDGLYISPISGRGKCGDFVSNAVLAAYQALIEHGAYPANSVVLGSFATYPRYAGPREALFTALCRKNMGCSHFVVGRDHTGVGTFYGPCASREILEEFESEIGLKPVFFDKIGYDARQDAYVAESGASNVCSISGSAIRSAILEGASIPDWMMRSCVVEALRAEIAAGRPVFVE